MPMPLFRLLSLYDTQVVPGRTKVHLASWNGHEHPLDVFAAGRFEEWQSWQSKRNFERPVVLSLISYPGTNRWLLAGVFDVLGSESSGHHFRYRLTERSSCSPLRGRVVVELDRDFRQSYRNAESIESKLVVRELLPEPYTVQPFPGYRQVDISKAILDTIVRRTPASWRTALASVAGVYLISDTKDGRLYVGSATGEGGLWQRWVSYSETGHGGNKLLKELLSSQGATRAQDFRFSILEIADIHDSEAELVQRESHWKRVLLTRDHGLNAN